MNKKLLSGLSLILFMPLCLFGEEKKEGVESKKWNLYFQTGLANNRAEIPSYIFPDVLVKGLYYSSNNYVKNGVVNYLGLERKLGDNFDLSFEVSRTSKVGSEKFNVLLNDSFQIPLFTDAIGRPSFLKTNIFLSSFDLVLFTFHSGLNYYFYKNDRFNSYIGFGIGLTSYTTSLDNAFIIDSGRLNSLNLKFGLRYNFFDSFYAIAEAKHIRYYGAITFYDLATIIGIGYNFNFSSQSKPKPVDTLKL